MTGVCSTLTSPYCTPPSDENLRRPEAPSLVYSPRERHYVDAIDRAYAYSSKTLLRLLMDEKDLMGRLR